MQLAAMDSARVHGFAFNETVSFIVHCETQEEIDYYWGKLSADPKAEQCGWLKDRYEVSWKIVPTVLDKMLRDQDKRKVAQVTEAFLEMKKFDIEALEKPITGNLELAGGRASCALCPSFSRIIYKAMLNLDHQGIRQFLKPFHFFLFSLQSSS